MKGRTLHKRFVPWLAVLVWGFASQVGVIEQIVPEIHESLFTHYAYHNSAHSHPDTHKHAHSHDHGHSHSHGSHEDTEHQHDPNDHTHNDLVLTTVNSSFTFTVSKVFKDDTDFRSLVAFDFIYTDLSTDRVFLSGLHPPPENSRYFNNKFIKDLPIDSNAPPRIA